MLTFGNGGMKNPSNPVHLTLPKSQHWSSFDNIYIYEPQTLSSGLFPGTPRIASSSAARHCFQARLELHPPRPRVTLLPYFLVILLNFLLYLLLYASIKLPTVSTLICFYLHSATSLHQHGTYGQPGEESLFPEESRSTPWASTCTCITEDSQSSLPIKCLNSNLRV
jgi:hypothetical protein